MKYRDYKFVAKKHLDACMSIFGQYSNEVPENVLREIHYLLGYVIEGICVYAIYEHFQWEEDRNIRDYNPQFTSETRLDYYKNGQRRDSQNQIIHTGATYCITSHGFNQYVEVLYVPFQGSNIPFIDASADIDASVKDMILGWKPDLRYRYGSKYSHSKSEIQLLIETCRTIYNQVVRNI